jgi:DNA polymerase
VIAELAGERWMQEEFRKPNPQIYEATAALIAGVPISEVGPKLRRLGKIGALASNYQGWVGAWTRAGADKYMDEEEMIVNILKYRKKSPAIAGDRKAGIIGLWGGLQEASMLAIERPGECFSYRSLAYQMLGDVLYCKLPSGRCIPYHRPRIYMEERNEKWQKAISYYGVDSQTKRFVKMNLYGGKETEQATQAVARDIFAAGLVRIEAVGIPVVTHSHDEPLCEVPLGSGDVARLEGLMTEPLEWCADWPIRASGGWIGQRYRK